MDFLRDPVWGFIGVVVAVLLGSAGIVVTLWLRNRKALAFDVLSSVPIVTVVHTASNAVAQAIEIRYDGNTVKDVWLVVVRIWNAGNVPIAPSDYIKPISVEFGGYLLASDVVEAVPDSFRHEVIAGAWPSKDFSAVAFNPVALNQRASVTIQALLTGFNGDVKVTGLVLGVPAIRRVSRQRISFTELMWTVLREVASAQRLRIRIRIW